MRSLVRFSLRRLGMNLCSAALLLAAFAGANAQTVRTIYNFGSATGDGSTPIGGLVAGSGVLYGVTSAGGSASKGAAFSVTLAGTETVFHNFGAIAGEGTDPTAAMYLHSDGNFYGTTTQGGGHSAGTVFKMTSGGVLSTLFSFTVSSGNGNAFPQAPLVLGTDGNFYSTNNDSVFQISTGGAESTLYTFGVVSKDGDSASQGLIQGTDGNFYGCTRAGGAHGSGTVFKLTPAKVETILYSFGTVASDGANPSASPIQGVDGNLYGTTQNTIFKITTGGTLTTLHTTPPIGIEGFQPRGAMLQASDGNFYGTEFNDDSQGFGTVFKMTPAGVYTTLYVFGTNPGDGHSPGGALVVGSDGNFYGTTQKGGSHSVGTVFEVIYDNMLQPVSIASSNANPALARIGDTVTLTMTSHGAIRAPAVTMNGATASVVNTSGNTWKASVPVVQGFLQGPVTFAITATDVAGFVALPVTSTTDASKVNIDYLPPLFSSVAISSNNTNSKFAKAGDIVTVKFSTSEAAHTPVVTIAGQTASVSNQGGNVWTASVAVTTASLAGSASFTISAQDLANNSAAVGTSTTDGSTVTIDPLPPTLSPVQITSTNANHLFAKSGDNVTLTFTASTAIHLPSVTIAGQPADVRNPSGNTWSATVPITPSSVPGPANFSIAVTDLAGNVALPATATTDGSNVTVDLAPASLAPVTIASSNAISSLAKAGDVISLAFTANEPIQVPSVTIAGQTAIVENSGGNSWIASITALPGSPQGPAAFSVATSDLAGNGATVTSVSDASNVNIDVTPPLLSGVSIASSNTNPHFARVSDVVTLGFTANEPIQTPSVIIAGRAATVSNQGGNAWTASVTVDAAFFDGLDAFAITATDLAGNVAPAVTASTDASSVRVQVTPPLLTTVGISSSNTRVLYAKPGDTITLTFEANEGIQVQSVTIAGQTVAAVNLGGNTWAATVTVTDAFPSGRTAFAITVADSAGNIASPVSETRDPNSIGITGTPFLDVVIDPSAPVFLPVTIGSTNANPAYAKVGDTITLKFTASQALDTLGVQICGVPATVSNLPGNSFSASVSVTPAFAQGTAAFSIEATDLAGNDAVPMIAATDGSSVTVDPAPPVLSPVALSSSNQNPLYAKAGDTLTVSFTASQGLQPPTIAIAGQPATIADLGASSSERLRHGHGCLSSRPPGLLHPGDRPRRQRRCPRDLDDRRERRRHRHGRASTQRPVRSEERVHRRNIPPRPHWPAHRQRCQRSREPAATARCVPVTCRRPCGDFLHGNGSSRQYHVRDRADLRRSG